MAWDGNVKRPLVGARPRAGGGSILMFECRHEQPSNLSPSEVIRKMREEVCVSCSLPYWERIANARARITFDQAIGKLRSLVRYKLQCECGATCWVRGDDEPDTNAVNLNESREREWEGGTEGHDHDNHFEIVDGEPDDDE